MTEENKQDVQEETQAQEPVETQEQVVEEKEAAEVAPKAESKPSKDENWIAAREVMRMQKQRIEELERYLSEQNKPKPVQQEPDEIDKLDPEDMLTVQQARKLAEKIAEKKAEAKSREIVEEYMRESTLQMDEQRMRSQYEDYDYVIKTFAAPQIQNDPALAYKIQQSKNPAETAYKLGKLSASYEEQNTMSTQPSKKAEKIVKNVARPVSSNAVGSPLKSQADQFSNMSREQVWEMSQKYARQG